MTTEYKAITPYGAFQASWGDADDSRVEYTGSADAIAYFKAYLDLNSVSGVGGALIQFDYLEPADFYGFCTSDKYAISVLPTDDDLMDSFEDEKMTTTTLLDSVGAAETFELIGEGAQILNRLDESADSFFSDLDRLRYIVQELGDEAAPASSGPSAYLQSVIDGTIDLAAPEVADELGKIHAEYKDDEAMLTLFKSAVKAYSDFAIARADAALAKG